MGLNSVNTNVGAMVALQSFNNTTTELGVVQGRINTGRKINNAKDNAAIWAIAQNQRAELSSFGAVKDSLSRGQSAVDVALSGGEQIADTLQKMKQLALNASDRNLDGNSRKAMETEYNTLAKQVSTTIQNANFNGVNMIDGSSISYRALANTKGTSTVDVASENLSLRTVAAKSSGPYQSTIDISNGLTTNATTATTFTIDADVLGTAATTITLAANTTFTADEIVTSIKTQLQTAGGEYAKLNVELAPGATTGSRVLRMTTNTTGATSQIVVAPVGGTSVASGASASVGTTASGGGGILAIEGNISFNSNTNFTVLLDQLDTSITNVSSALGRLGSGSKAMEASAAFVSKLQDTLEAGIGALVDADLAKESARLQALQTKQQLGVQALSIANQSTGVILGLFR